MNHRILAIALLSLTSISSAYAQVGPTLLVAYPKDQQAQFTAQSNFSPAADIESSPLDATLLRWDVAGRFQFDTEEPKALRFGFEYSNINIDSDSGILPEQLTQLAFGAGATVFQSGPWQLDAAAGIGYAGNTPLTDSDAIYVAAGLALTRVFENKHRLQLYLDYNGNRSIFPDIPLPGISYAGPWGDRVQWMVGFPLNRISWQPEDDVRISASLFAFTAGDIRAEFDITPWLTTYASVSSETLSYWVDSATPHQRIFFSQYQAELGARSTPAKQVTVLLAFGFAFSQQFETGWDTRNATTLAELSDEPYVRVGVEINF